MRNREVRLEWKEVEFGRQAGAASLGTGESVGEWAVHLRAMARLLKYFK